MKKICILIIRSSVYSIFVKLKHAYWKLFILFLFPYENPTQSKPWIRKYFYQKNIIEQLVACISQTLAKIYKSLL